ncbi:type II toxin-antitoxin system HicB family antitoxin [Patescibacteria group bacterium]|nr:type II toxin-antitoxin system HicB family antitoxin [Patescibacteria group bacterium]MBU4512644.1 type II toxin-antitoxin system HicB family antitoxin [Patescibacteria group bacterium]MCG2693550.1 type II toxin-antitoxin system HicB family antitoxin [Candidatus Parcubacteria bacterium]
MKNYIAIIKKFNSHFVALCPELNVSAQGETLLEAREQLKDAIEEYLEFSGEEKITSASLDVETLREFSLETAEVY